VDKSRTTWKVLTVIEKGCPGDGAENSDKVQQDLQRLIILFWYWCEMVFVRCVFCQAGLALVSKDNPPNDMIYARLSLTASAVQISICPKTINYLAEEIETDRKLT
jgi:hypothetical protein